MAQVPEDDRSSQGWACGWGFSAPCPLPSPFALLSPPHLGPPLGTPL